MAIPPPPDGFQKTEIESLDTEGVLVAGINLFNQQHYWYAHEVWESKWLELPRQEKHLVQGLIQFAAAMHHAQNENQYGFGKLISRALSSISKASPRPGFIPPELITQIIKLHQEEGCPTPSKLLSSGGPKLPQPQSSEAKKISETLSGRQETG